MERASDIKAFPKHHCIQGLIRKNAVGELQLAVLPTIGVVDSNTTSADPNLKWLRSRIIFLQEM